MPKQEGRGFDVYEAIGWEQRVNKERSAILDDEAVVKEMRRRQKQRRRDLRFDARLDRLEQEVRGVRQTASMPNLMNTTDAMPDNIRQLRRFPVTDSCLMTMRPTVKKDEGLVPRLRFSPRLVDAHWVPGGKLVSYKPKFSMEAEPDPKSIRKPWRMPAAGHHPVPALEPAAASATRPVADVPYDVQSMGRSRDSRTRWTSDAYLHNEVADQENLRGTRGSLRQSQMQSSAASFRAPSLHCRFAESATSLMSSAGRQVPASGRRQRVNTLAVAGGSALPRINEAS